MYACQLAATELRPHERLSTGRVYDTVVAQGTAVTAQAVHEAIKRLRDRRRDLPQLWAAYIHTGA